METRHVAEIIMEANSNYFSSSTAENSRLWAPCMRHFKPPSSATESRSLDEPKINCNHLASLQIQPRAGDSHSPARRFWKDIGPGKAGCIPSHSQATSSLRVLTHTCPSSRCLLPTRQTSPWSRTGAALLCNILYVHLCLQATRACPGL